MQLFDEKFAEAFEFDVLDATKLIPEEQIPVRKVGRLVLNRPVENFLCRNRTSRVLYAKHNTGRGFQ